MKSKSSLSYGVWRSGVLLLVLSADILAWSGLRTENVRPQIQEKKPTSKQNKSNEFHEDLKSLAVQDSNFLPPKLTLLERTEGKNARYHTEHFRVIFRPGEPQELFVILPEGVKNPPIGLYMFSYPETVARFQSELWAQSAVGRGHAAIGFSSGVSGDGANRSLSRDEFLKELPKNLVQSSHDIQLVLNYLASRGDLNLDRVGVYGSGSGASAAILASAADSRIKVLDVFNPWGAWPEFFAKSSMAPAERRDSFVKPEFLQSVAGCDPVAWFAKSRARSVRIQDVRQQDWVPTGAQERIEDAAPAFAEVNQFEDYRILLEMQGSGMVFSWIQEQLLPDAKPQTVVEKSKRTHYFVGKGHTLGEPASPPH